MYKLSNIARSISKRNYRKYNILYNPQNSVCDSIIYSIDELLLLRNNNIDTNIDIIITYSDNASVEYESLSRKHQCPLLILGSEKTNNKNNIYGFMDPTIGIPKAPQKNSDVNKKDILYIIDKDPRGSAMILNFMQKLGLSFDVLNPDKFVTMDIQTVYDIFNSYNFSLINTYGSTLLASVLSGCYSLTFNISLSEAIPGSRIITEKNFMEEIISGRKNIKSNALDKYQDNYLAYKQNLLEYIENLIQKPFIL
jgi:hypothetical protein